MPKSFVKRRCYFIPKLKVVEVSDANTSNASTSRKKIESSAKTNIAEYKFCNKLDSLIFSEDSGNRRGLCVNLVLQCIYCGQATSAMSSDMTKKNI
uniref:Uncharacterized protein n=1 Tax=Nephila pilipes TaxID=299642 RepID=A0A8X6MNF4_NEPPI|nr:hypothetical protein NPIL_534471 [Nephila pilipes]GFT29778.1 hypothetical protein NPIL_63521 [Nephila pilipes]